MTMDVLPPRHRLNAAAGVHPVVLAIAVLLVCVLAAGPAWAKTVLVVAPHPDDEALMAAGVIRHAVEAGDTVKVIVVTNGDYPITSLGYLRQGESVSAMSLVGLTEDDVIFLGYGDALLMRLYDAVSETTVLTSLAGRTQTYGNRGLGRLDYHTYRHGVAGDYNRRTLLEDLTDLLVTFSPDDIYTTSYYDAHYDHKAVYLFLVEVLARLKQQGSDVRARLHEMLVHAPCPPCNPWGGDPAWPPAGFAPAVPLPEPQYLASTPLRWTRAERLPVPPAMQSPHQATNPKWQAIDQYDSQRHPWLFTFVKRDEVAWITDFGLDLAPTATVTVSSENTATRQVGRKAVDHVVAGAPADPPKEWATTGQLAGAWIRLTWDSPVIVSAVSLHDRPSPTENVQAGRLLFSDGSVMAVGALPPDGAALTLTFPPHITSWVEFRIDGAVGSNAGLAEIRVLGKPGASADNHAPVILEGPTGTPVFIADTETASLTVEALDVDGDGLQYSWSAESGAVAGAGPTATFTPVRATTETFVAVTVTISDGRGGTVTNTTFVKVRPAPTATLQTFTVAESILGSGQSTSGTVALSGVAPAGGIVVGLATAGTSAVMIPASVTVPAGATSATFTITGAPVAATTLTSVSASGAGVVKTAGVTVVPNLAGQAKVKVSSQNSSTGQLGIKAVDGVVGGWPDDPTKEWVTRPRAVRGWIRLTWSTPRSVSEVSLYDRPSLGDNILAGRLRFSDRSEVAVGALPPDGAELRVAFPARTVTWVEFQVDRAVGHIGLAEIRVFSKTTTAPIVPVAVVPNLASQAHVSASSEDGSTR